MRYTLLVIILLSLLFAVPLNAQSKALPLSMSALMPGSGEIILGKTTRGGIMVAADLVALTAWLATGREINNLTSSYQQYAKTYAGIPDEMSDKYYQHIQQYLSSDDFNNNQILGARNYYLIYGYDPQAYADYVAENTYSEDEAWAWQSPEHQAHYRSLRYRTQSTKMYQNLSLGVMLLNRFVSLIDVALISRDSQKPTPVYFSPLENGGLMLNYTLEF
ncbi:MAG: hypothetical protein GX135_00920 [Candidatus Cloacimonetes bacterium]|nr:hypothetical protein [Candidatus Cloacimonadota bacterium]MDX9949403.1 hypothetical protein [Candidatus Syntrophosphaera sp.]NLN84649.1 hypothetical protein [Candidatus Cloacimonadota bacterium]